MPEEKQWDLDVVPMPGQQRKKYLLVFFWVTSFFSFVS